ncbi:MAG: DUF2069 domain-containing protein [Halioglobus sp.]|jgi:uncharacterized membrane protein|nr:DUF2069 domain-containing protein [Halioglobus sp.]
MSISLSSIASRLTWTSWSILLLQQAADAWTHQAPWFIWVLKVLPLLIFVPGMLKDNLRSYIWLCFVCLGYFMILVQRIFAQPDSLMVVTGLVAVVILFTVAMLYVRWRARDLRVIDGSETDTGA